MARSWFIFGLTTALLLGGCDGKARDDADARRERKASKTAIGQAPRTWSSPDAAKRPPSGDEPQLYYGQEDGFVRFSQWRKGTGEHGEKYRIEGDTFSKYYVVDLYSGDGDEDQDILDDHGASILPPESYWGIGFPNVGVRKTRAAITIIGYFPPGLPGDSSNEAESFGTYVVITIKRGKAKRDYGCTVSQRTFERATGQTYRSRAAASAAADSAGIQGELSMDMLVYLTELADQRIEPNCE